MNRYVKILSLSIIFVLMLGVLSIVFAAEDDEDNKTMQKVAGQYMDTSVEIDVKLTDPASVEVDEKDYFRYLTEAEIGDGLTIPIDEIDDYDKVREVATAEALDANEKAVQKRKARRIDKDIIRKAKKEAKEKAKVLYEERWQLINEEMPLPNDTKGTTKTYMNYKTVTATGTPQYALLNSQKAFTRDGFRMYDGYYCVALGSAYSKVIGTKFEIELSTGQIINCILGDQKSDRHTDANHQYAVRNGDIVEFIVDDDLELAGGDVSAISGFEGEVVSITKISEPTFPYTEF